MCSLAFYIVHLSTFNALVTVSQISGFTRQLSVACLAESSDSSTQHSPAARLPVTLSACSLCLHRELRCGPLWLFLSLPKNDLGASAYIQSIPIWASPSTHAQSSFTTCLSWPFLTAPMLCLQVCCSELFCFWFFFCSAVCISSTSFACESESSLTLYYPL